MAHQLAFGPERAAHPTGIVTIRRTGPRGREESDGVAICRALRLRRHGDLLQTHGGPLLRFPCSASRQTCRGLGYTRRSPPSSCLRAVRRVPQLVGAGCPRRPCTTVPVCRGAIRTRSSVSTRSGIAAALTVPAQALMFTTPSEVGTRGAHGSLLLGRRTGRVSLRSSGQDAWVLKAASDPDHTSQRKMIA
jgi:hypothetical protein